MYFASGPKMSKGFQLIRILMQGGCAPPEIGKYFDAGGAAPPPEIR